MREAAAAAALICCTAVYCGTLLPAEGLTGEDDLRSRSGRRPGSCGCESLDLSGGGDGGGSPGFGELDFRGNEHSVVGEVGRRQPLKMDSPVDP